MSGVVREVVMELRGSSGVGTSGGGGIVGEGRNSHASPNPILFNGKRNLTQFKNAFLRVGFGYESHAQTWIWILICVGCKWRNPLPPKPGT